MAFPHQHGEGNHGGATGNGSAGASQAFGTSGFDADLREYVPMPMQSSGSSYALMEPAPRHDYQATLEVDVDKWLTSEMGNCHTIFTCHWTGCFKKLYRGLFKARLHVHGHLKTLQPVECIACGAKFASEDSAKRHRDYQEKVYRCDFCNKAYARPDYVLAHMKNCTLRGSTA